MAKLTPMCDLCHGECPEDEPHPGMCDDCKASYEKALKYLTEVTKTEMIDPTRYLMNWAASVAREGEYRRAHRFEHKKQLLSIEETRRQLAKQEAQLKRREERDSNFENWRDDPEWKEAQ